MSESKALDVVGHGLTEAQEALVDTISSDRWDEVAQDVGDDGYEKEKRAVGVLRSERVQTELRSRRTARIGGPLAQKALKAMEMLLDAPETPASVRFSTAKWMLEQAGHTEGQADGADKPLHEMSEKELHAFMERAQRVVDGGGSRPIIKVTPDNGA